MNVKLLVVVSLLLGSILFVIAWYLAFYKSEKNNKKCTRKTRGKVVRYAYERYMDNRHFYIPVVSYEVDGEKYETIGPNFRAVIFKRFGKGKKDVKTNIVTIDDLPHTLEINTQYKSDNESKAYALKDYFPVDSSVDVYYDPNNPKRSYVHRLLDYGKLKNLHLIFGIIMVVVALVMFLVL